MIAAVAFAVLAQAVEPQPARGRVVDAGAGAPVPMASVRAGAVATITDASGAFTLRARVGDTIVVRRVGYGPAIAVVGAGPLLVRLVPAATPLAAVRVRDSAAAVARLSASVSVDDLRTRGAFTLAEGVRTLPFVAARGARGQTVVSMRGSRAEQVAVTIDGVAINDPATGVADLSDLPLAAFGAVTAVPGSDVAGAGSGATGGVLALSSGAGAVLAVQAGAYGRRGAEGAGSVRALGGSVRAGASVVESRNDFPFVNRLGATGSDSVERRVNADERRAAVFASGAFPRAQVTLLASAAEQGMVGPMNVRAYDRDRGATRRGLLRVAVPVGAALAQASVRAFGTRYRDPAASVNDYDAASTSADVELGRAVGALAVRAGAGADRATGEALRGAARTRAFVAAAHAVQHGPWRVATSLRGDAIRHAGARLSPSLSVERALGGGVAAFARAAQAFRAPTLYDLYFAGAQRLVARELRPERVTFDGELGARVGARGLRGSASVFERRTRDAIVWFPGNFGWSASNVGRERVRGAEARVEASFDAGSVSAWAATYHARLSAGGLVIPTPYVPAAAGGIVGEAHRGPLALTATMQATGRRAFGSGPVSRAYELPGVALVGAHASYSFHMLRAPVRLTVGAENVGDVEWQQVRAHPTPGRSWSASLTLRP